MLHLLFSYVLKQIGRESFSSYIYAYLHIYRIQNISIYTSLYSTKSIIYFVWKLIQDGRSTWTCSCDSCLDSSHFLFLLIPRESFRCQHSIGTEQVSGGLRPPEQPQGHEGLQGHEGPSQDVTWMVQNRAFPMKALLRVQTSLHPYQKNSYDSYDHHGKLEFQVWGRRCWSSLHLGS